MTGSGDRGVHRGAAFCRHLAWYGYVAYGGDAFLTVFVVVGGEGAVGDGVCGWRGSGECVALTGW